MLIELHNHGKVSEEFVYFGDGASPVEIFCLPPAIAPKIPSEVKRTRYYRHPQRKSTFCPRPGTVAFLDSNFPISASFLERLWLTVCLVSSAVALFDSHVVYVSQYLIPLAVIVIIWDLRTTSFPLPGYLSRVQCSLLRGNAMFSGFP